MSGQVGVAGMGSESGKVLAEQVSRCQMAAGKRLNALGHFYLLLEYGVIP